MQVSAHHYKTMPPPWNATLQNNIKDAVDQIEVDVYTDHTGKH